MLVTVTLNPAVDYTIQLNAPLRYDSVNRTTGERITAGGKGINVSYIAKQFHVPTTIYTFAAGLTGTMLQDFLQEMELPTQAIQLEGQMNRINVKVEETGAVTELNGRGITVSSSALAQLTKLLRQYGKDDIIVLAGRIPAGAKKTIYADMMEELSSTDVRFAIDTEGSALRATLPYHPFVVKPNLPELSALFSVPLRDWKEALPYCRKLKDMGAQNVLLSLAEEGALLLADDGKEYRMAVPEGNLVNAVGAGDAMLAGFLCACMEGKNREEALRYGVAAGSATAYAPWLANEQQIQNLLTQLPVLQTLER